MIHPDYVYMFHNWYSNEWWTQPPPDCEIDEVQRVLEFSLLFGHYPRIPEDMKNVTNVGNLVCEKRCYLHMHSNKPPAYLLLNALARGI